MSIAEVVFSMRWCLSFTLFISAAFVCLSADAQTPVTNPPAKDKAEPSVSSSMVPADTPVIRIQGLCSSDPSTAKPATTSKTTGSTKSKAEGSPTPHKSAPASAGCEADVTRAQYEKLARVIAPKQEPSTTIQLAHFYSTEMQQKANAKADAEFDQYFKQHPEEFELASVLQISVPKQKLQPDPDQAGATPAPKVDNAPDPAALKAEADKIRARAVAGEDFEKLETEVYTFAGDPDAAPDTDMGTNNRADLGEFGKKIFALQPGEVSQVLSGKEAWHIFKLVSKETMSPDDAKKRIAGKFMKETMESVNGAVNPQLNEAYFGPAAGEKANPGG